MDRITLKGDLRRIFLVSFGGFFISFSEAENKELQETQKPTNLLKRDMKPKATD